MRASTTTIMPLQVDVRKVQPFALGALGVFVLFVVYQLGQMCQAPPAAPHASAHAPLSFALDPVPIRGPFHWEALNEELRNEFTMHGDAEKHDLLMFFDLQKGIPADLTYPEATTPVWKKADLQRLIKQAHDRNPEGMTGYGAQAPRDFFAAFDKHPVKGKKVLVVGTLNPWIEAIAHVYGAAQVYTVDFNRPVSEMPDVFRTLSIAELDDAVRAGLRFDAICSYSSLEHDGMGRYGDPIDPNADLKRVQRLRGLVSSHGLLYLAVPVGQDRIYWNAHRVYGRKRFPMLTHGWTLLGRFVENRYGDDIYDVPSDGYTQPLHVLRLAE